MSIKRSSRYGLVLCFAVLLSGCSSTSPMLSNLGFWGSGSAAESNECAPNPRSCIYKGRYESGESAYAVLEAERLNKIALEKLRRNAIR